MCDGQGQGLVVCCVAWVGFTYPLERDEINVWNMFSVPLGRS